MRIGLIAMSAKPYHAGHDGLIRLAARECGAVHLYVSLSDRARSGEVPVLGSDMKRVWGMIEPTLPPNVEVEYGGSPVGKVWKELGAASEAGSQDTYVVYGDPTDVTQNFTEALMERYAGSLFDAGRIIVRPVERSSTTDVSGTQMRRWLASGDKESFLRNLPKGIDADAVWNVLRKTAKGPSKVKATAGPVRKPAAKKAPKAEALLRSYLRLALRG